MSKRRENNPTTFDDATTQSAWEDFTAFLRRRSERVTEPRRIVFQEVFSRHDHFRADQLAQDLRRGEHRVSRGTIYRTLALLCKAGLIREIRDADVHAHYEHIFGHRAHEHMICKQCGKFIEFEDPQLERRLEKACEERDFKPLQHRVTVFGLCKACR